MKKLYLYISFILSLFFFNEAKAQTLTSDVVVCSKTTGNIVNHSQFLAGEARNSTIYRQCDTTGSSVSSTLRLHKIGLCTSAPTVKFVNADARTNDQRRPFDGEVGDSIFTSCQIVVDSTEGYLTALSSAGDVSPIGTDEIVNPGTYTHGIFVIDESVSITAVVNFSGNVTSVISGQDSVSTRCITNGSTIIDTGEQGPIVNGVQNANGGALCHPSTAATANTIRYLYSGVDGIGNTTRNTDSTSLGSVNIYNVNDNLQRVEIKTESNGTTTATTKLLLVVTFTNPLVVTENYQYLDVLQNLSRTVSLDFEQGNPLASTTIRLIQQGPFGIAFRSIEDGSKF
jgi:hypothetical protein